MAREKRHPVHHVTKKPVEHFEVIDQTESPTPQADGSIENVWTITFRTASDVVGYVTVPDSEYRADTVGGLIAVKAAEIDKVDALGA